MKRKRCCVLTVWSCLYFLFSASSLLFFYLLRVKSLSAVKNLSTPRQLYPKINVRDVRVDDDESLCFVKKSHFKPEQCHKHHQRYSLTKQCCFQKISNLRNMDKFKTCTLKRCFCIDVFTSTKEPLLHHKL